MKILTSVEAQNRFGELLDSVQREPVTITRRGRTVAVVLSAEDMEELADARRGRERAVAAFDEYFARTAAKLKNAAKSLTDEDIAKLVHGPR
ncbi:MAG: type II toxin-antitoxin system Phd/YefM family antitoxin [Nevskia sp.]|nr:type II toxin-antitoxin system Phd/YefM family antitoxin [Nevskia sp.]